MVDIKYLPKKYTLTKFLNLVFLLLESSLKLHIFLYLYFILNLYFPFLLRKKIKIIFLLKSKSLFSILTIKYINKYYFCNSI